jgi:two-component system, NarL family, nitrate/nitrite response regulator NarL
MQTQNNLQVLIVDDHQILIDGVKKLLYDTRFNVVSECTRAADAMKILANNKIDIAICDLSLPEVSDGIELIKGIRKGFPLVKIVVLTMHDERCIVHDIINYGVSAYLLKNINQIQLVHALERVNANKFYISEDISDILLDKFQTASDMFLSERESEILKLVIREYSNKQLAETLFISERTVETHRKNIYKKTNTNNIVGLIKFALEHKLD